MKSWVTNHACSLIYWLLSHLWFVTYNKACRHLHYRYHLVSIEPASILLLLLNTGSLKENAWVCEWVIQRSLLYHIADGFVINYITKYQFHRRSSILGGNFCEYYEFESIFCTPCVQQLILIQSLLKWVCGVFTENEERISKLWEQHIQHPRRSVTSKQNMPGCIPAMPSEWATFLNTHATWLERMFHNQALLKIMSVTSTWHQQ